MEIDWHAERTHLDPLCLLDRDPADAEIDQVAVRAYRLGRVREQMGLLGIDACLLFDPINVRYASGSRNMQVFSQRNPARYLFVPLTGPVVLFEFMGCEHLADGIETIDEVRPAITASFVAAGPHITERERIWARECGDLIREHCGPQARVGIERVNAGAAMSLSAEGFRIVDAQYPVELARAIKSEEELKCIRSSVRATERAVTVLRDCLEPGLTEEQLWSILHQGVIAQGGDYVETRLLNAGERTNPWFQEASGNVIGPNELVALDTDVVGCFGYYTDFSRTFHSGPDKPTEYQKTLYKTALEQLRHNMSIIRPGMTFREYSEHAWDIPERYLANRYYLSAHGSGMTGEYPYLYHRMEYEHAGYDGVIEPNMTLCVESYIGEEGGHEGVKLEQHCLITESGLEVLSQFPFEEALMDESIHAAPDPRLVPSGEMPSAEVAEAGSAEPARVIAREARFGPANVQTDQQDESSGKTPATREPVPSPRRPPRESIPGPRIAETGATPRTAGAVPISLPIECIDVTLLGDEGPDGDIADRCLRAAAEGVKSIAVPPRRVRAAVTALVNHDVSVRITVGLPGNGTTTAARALEVRRALRAGARGVDLVIDTEAIRADDVQTALDDLCRTIDPAREARARTAVIVECGRLDGRQQVMAARIAARVRPDVIATGSGIDGDGATARQVALIRECAGTRPSIRALLGPGADDTDTLGAAGADRFGITGGTANAPTERSA